VSSPARRVGVALLASAAAAVTLVPAHAGASVPASQSLVILKQDHVARTGPDTSFPRIASIRRHQPLTGVRTVLPVFGYTVSAAGATWVHVRLPGRPNGHKGWILAARTMSTSTPWRLVVRLSTRRLTVYRGGRVERRFEVVVGKPSTPTPRGRFFIEEALSLSRSSRGGPFALATSARSNVLQHFEGGPGQIALHGTRGLSGRPGSAASHGCIRLSTAAITWLAQRIGAGVPLTVTR
jgi:lipoprotein-anchoring transpeptidase ErfK/SrfK